MERDLGDGGKHELPPSWRGKGLKKTGEKRRYLPTSGTLPRNLTLGLYVVLHRERGFYQGGSFLDN